MVEKARPAVVSVVAEVVTLDIFLRPLKDFQSGTGVIFDPRGYILTNNHVIEGGQRLVVTLEDGRQMEATVIGADRLTDLAVLKVEGEGFPALPVGDSSQLRVGEWVITIGNALALPGGPTVTVGVVSALGRSLDVEEDLTLYDLIQTDALINPGNSGGPLLNLRGEVVGINTAILRGAQVEGIGFAIPTETFVPVSQQLVEQGRVVWPWLGVVISDLDPTRAAELGLPPRQGVLVTSVLRGSPAATGGMRPGDVILTMGDAEVSDARGFIKLLRFSHRAGEEVEFQVHRQGEEVRLEVTLGERPTQ